MANIPSQIKRNRQNEKRRLRNRDFRGSARTAVKDAFTAIASGQVSPTAITAAVRALDKAATKGAIHPRNAARRKSRLLKRLAASGVQPTGFSPATAPAEKPSSQAEHPAKAEKRGAPAAEAKSKQEPKKTATKAVTKKTASKKSTKK